jgi:isochorismate synthase
LNPDISHILSTILSQQSFVLYRLPHEQNLQLVAGTLMRSGFSRADESGFYIASFAANDMLWYIRPELKLTLENLLSQSDFRLRLDTHERYENETPHDYYVDMIAKAVNDIRSGDMHKVVLSRNRQVELPADFNVLHYLDRLTKKYPGAFVYLLCSPELGTWAGATPELLLESEGDHISTVSLAGTKRLHAELEPISLFSQKEIDEQAWVTDYIQDILTSYSSDVSVNGPTARPAGDIAHLVTDFDARMEHNDLHLILLLLQQLHPTPAVCGTPKEKARRYILEAENYARELYSGFLGWIEDERADVFVNLRCMQLFEGFATLYAGAGIVHDSIPEEEWQETEAKMQTLLSVL